MRGNCYVTTEAVYHLTGGAAGPWRPQTMRNMGDTHWFLRHKDTDEVLDLTVSQFGGKVPDYSKARGCGFLTKAPSKRAAALMAAMVWQGSK